MSRSGKGAGGNNLLPPSRKEQYMTYLHQPRWHDYLLAFVLITGGLALSTVYLAPILAGGIPALLDTYRGPQ